MKKLFISQPMNGRSDEEILAEREAAFRKAEQIIGETVEVIDSFLLDVPESAGAMWYIGESILLMDEADVVYFVKGWKNYRGCQMEHICAVKYGMDIIEEEDSIEERKKLAEAAEEKDNLTFPDQILREKREKLKASLKETERTRRYWEERRIFIQEEYLIEMMGREKMSKVSGEIVRVLDENGLLSSPVVAKAILSYLSDEVSDKLLMLNDVYQYKNP